MSGHGMRQQKKLAKQKAKRTEKRTQLARQTSVNPMIRLANCQHWPIEAALVAENLFNAGIGSVVLARRMPDGNLAVGIFLVDVYCLGVKNALYSYMSLGKFAETGQTMTENEGPFKSVTPEHVAKLVTESVAYAQQFGLPPHPDYRAAQLILGGIDPAKCDVQFELGQNGKPLYVSGPFDSEEKKRLIMSRITPEGGHYLLETSRQLSIETLDPELLEDESQADEFEADEDENS